MALGPAQCKIRAKRGGSEKASFGTSCKVAFKAAEPFSLPIAFFTGRGPIVSGKGEPQLTGSQHGSANSKGTASLTTSLVTATEDR
jgi:hypothetical protein